jgi:uncharacterized protein YgiM (DUF1202 family)
MTNTKTLFIPLFLLMLACSTSIVQSTATPVPTAWQANTAVPSLTPAPQVCQIETGFEAGTVNLRTCGGTTCPSATILHEGERLTRTLPQAVDGWVPVRNSSGLSGWVNSRYCKGE